ncbi:hypothetical protein PHLGIDRAFT_129705, partial [Phlebiopsis gigantea 11061_1 CR5-6]
MPAPEDHFDPKSPWSNAKHHVHVYPPSQSTDYRDHRRQMSGYGGGTGDGVVVSHRPSATIVRGLAQSNQDLHDTVAQNSGSDTGVQPSSAESAPGGRGHRHPSSHGPVHPAEGYVQHMDSSATVPEPQIRQQLPAQRLASAGQTLPARSPPHASAQAQGIPGLLSHQPTITAEHINNQLKDHQPLSAVKGSHKRQPSHNRLDIDRYKDEPEHQSIIHRSYRQDG